MVWACMGMLLGCMGVGCMGVVWGCMGMLSGCMGMLWGCMGMHGDALGLHGGALGLHGNALGLRGDSVHGKGWHGNHGWRVPQVREWERHSYGHGHWHGVLVWSGEAGLWEQVGLVHRASWLGRACRTGRSSAGEG